MIEFLREAAKKHFPFREGGVANYGWITKEGIVTVSPTTVCHAGINHPQSTDFVCVVSQIMNSENMGILTPEIEKEYYQWLLNDSPLSPIYLTKDVDQVFEDGFILLNVDHPRNAVLTACILHRYIWEEIKVPRVWHDLVEAGIDKDGAFVLAHLVPIGYSDYDNLSKKMVYISSSSNNSNHSIFNGVLSKGTMTNFKKRKMVHAMEYNYCDFPNRSQDGCTIGNLFQTERDARFGINCMITRIDNLVSELCTPKKEGSKNNPFGKAHINTRYKYPDLINALAKLYPKICEEDEKCAVQ